MTAPSGLDKAAKSIVDAGRFLASNGWAPATSGNYSVRLDDGSIAITVSGRHKGRLSPDDVMRIDGDGKPLEDKKPSAETLLHVQIYDRVPQAGAILHVHSVPGVALTRLMRGSELVLSNYEMLKIFPGIDTHEVTLRIPVVDNAQDMVALSKVIAPHFEKAEAAPAYLIRDHGFYVWAPTMPETEHLAEAFEHLLMCELETRKLNPGASQ